MANQYCKITSWIEHNKKHGDPEYAKAISDLCLESYLNPSKYNGLTFLYQTDKKIKEKFIDAKFKSAARTLCDQFKRHILPDVFLSCEDFQKKDVGNILGKKYKVKSCTKDTVIFENGMKLHSIGNTGADSFEPLSENLKDIIKIYYIVEGDPNTEEVGDYKINYRNKLKHTLGGAEPEEPPNDLSHGRDDDDDSIHSFEEIDQFTDNLDDNSPYYENGQGNRSSHLGSYSDNPHDGSRRNNHSSNRKDNSDKGPRRDGRGHRKGRNQGFDKRKGDNNNKNKGQGQGFYEKKRKRGGTAQEFSEVYNSSELRKYMTEKLSIENIRSNSGNALNVALHMLTQKLKTLENNQEIPTITPSSTESSEHIFGDTAPQSEPQSEPQSQSPLTVLGGSKELHSNLKNLILAQWLVNSCVEGIIPYIYLCLFVLYKSEPANSEFQAFINDLIINMLKSIIGDTIDVQIDMGPDYIENLTTISQQFGFTRDAMTQTTHYKICEYIDRLRRSDADIKEQLINQFFQRITNFSNIWSGNFIPKFDGYMSEYIPTCATFLSLWTLTLFSLSMDETATNAKLIMLDTRFYELINTNSMDFNIECIFDKETLTRFLSGPAIPEGTDEIERVTNSATGLSENISPYNNSTQPSSIFD